MSLANDEGGPDKQKSNSEIRFMTKGVFCTLKNPLKISQLPRKLDFELRLAKLKADSNLLGELTNIFGYRIDKFSSIKSVFETAAFFTQILNSCQEKFSSIDINATDQTKDNVLKENDLDHSGHDSHHSGPASDVNKSCSVQYGHSELPLEISSISSENRKFWKLNKSDKVFCDNECEFHLKTEETKFTAIITPPITRGNYEVFDVSSFLALNPFCKRCSTSSLPIPSFSKPSFIDKPLSRTLLKLNKASQILLNEKIRKLKSKIDGTHPHSEGYICSPEYNEDSDDSGIFQSYHSYHNKQSKTLLKNPNPNKQNGGKNASIHGATNTFENIIPARCKASEKVELSSSMPGFTDLPVVKKSHSKYKDVTNNVIGVSYPIRESTSIVSVPNGAELASSENCYLNAELLDKVLKRKWQPLSSPDLEGNSSNNRKVYICSEGDHKQRKAAKKKKKKLQKKNKKLSISLSPPPGQDLDEYLQEQLILIKSQLAAKKDTDLTSTEIKQNKKLSKRLQILSVSLSKVNEAENSSAQSLESNQLKHISGHMPQPSDTGVKLVACTGESNKNTSQRNKHFHSPSFNPTDSSSPYKAEHYAYPPVDGRLIRRSPPRNRDYKSSSEGDHKRSREGDHKYANHKSNHSPLRNRDKNYYTSRDRPVYSPSDRKYHTRSPVDSKKRPSNSSNSLQGDKRDDKYSIRSRETRTDLSRRRKVENTKEGCSHESTKKQDYTETSKMSFSVKKKGEKNPLLDFSDDSIKLETVAEQHKEKAIDKPNFNSSSISSKKGNAGETVVSENNLEVALLSDTNSNQSPIVISEEGSLLTISEDSESEVKRTRKIGSRAVWDNPHLDEARQFVSRETSNSVSPPGVSGRLLKRYSRPRSRSRSRFHSRSRFRSRSRSHSRSRFHSRSRSRSRSSSATRKKLLKQSHGSRAPSPSVTNEKYYKTKVLEVKKTIESAAINRSLHNIIDLTNSTEAVQQLETTTVYQYQSTAGVQYPPPLMYPTPMYPTPMAFPYQEQQPYYPQHMVQYRLPHYRPGPFYP